MKADDASLAPEDYAMIRKHARLALQGASALGRFPTPVADVMDHAKVLVAEEAVLDEGFLKCLRRNVSGALYRALTKVRGVLDVVARIAYIDRSLIAVKQTFLKLHETAHAVLPHQRKLYALVEDCEKTISPEVSDQFDREANVFAAEVLFQLDAFIDEARREPFGIRVPLKLSKRFGASVYASVRQYVRKHDQACCVLVIDPPQFIDGDGFVASLRRVVTSAEFERQFGILKWPTSFTPGDDVGAAIPIGKRRMSRPMACGLIDQNGTQHECLIEAFNSQHQVFVLVHAINTLTRKSVIMRTTPV